MQHLDTTYKNLKKMPNDPHDPYYYHVYEDTLPKEYHYRIVPKDKDHCTQSVNDFKKKGYQRRAIYQGWNNYTDFEK